jgi:hypothetical protein
MRNNNLHAFISLFHTITRKKSGSGDRTCRHDYGYSGTNLFQAERGEMATWINNTDIGMTLKMRVCKTA